MPGAVYHGARGNNNRIDVHVEPAHGVPVDDNARDDAVVNDDVFDANRVKNHRSRFARAENQSRRHFDGIDRVKPVPARNGRNFEIAENFCRVVLNDDFVHQHSAAPNAAAGREFAFVNCDFVAGFCEVSRGDESARSCADDGDVHREAAFEFFEKRTHDCARDLFFHNHVFLLFLLFFFVFKRAHGAGTPVRATRSKLPQHFLRRHYPDQVRGYNLSRRETFPRAPLTENLRESYERSRADANKFSVKRAGGAGCFYLAGTHGSFRLFA